MAIFCSRPFFALLACLPLSTASARTTSDPSPDVSALASTPTPPIKPTVPQIGMNLDGTGLVYYGWQFAFIDHARSLATNSWSVTDFNYRGLPADSIRINASTGLPGGQAGNVQFVNTVFNIEPVTAPVPHRYVISWKGTAEIEIGFNAAANVKRSKQSYTFDFTGTGSQAQIIIRRLTDKDPIRDLHIVRVDQLPQFEAGQVFNPAFLDKVKNWRVIRFMDWSRTNGSPIVDFSQLPRSDALSFGDDHGVPLRTMVDLCNTAKTDMWYNIPAHASDGFVREALTFIKANLAPSLTLHLEYSNEVWNGGFEQARYAQEQGRALGVRLGLDHAIGSMEWYGYRSAQIAKITDEVFGSNARAHVKNVIAPQTYYVGLEQYIWEGVKLSKLGTPATLFEDYAVTTYFGHSFGGGSDADKAKVLVWARSGPAGLDAAFRELATGGLLSENSSLENLKIPLAAHAKIARQYGLDLVAYEGGQHLTAGGYAGQDQDEITAFIGRLVNDPRMGQLYTRMVDEFGAVGGKTLVAFSDVGGVSKFGAWGVLDNTYQNGSPRYDALVAAQKRAAQRP